MSALRGKRHWQGVDASVQAAVQDVAAREAADRAVRALIRQRVREGRQERPAVAVDLIRMATYVMDRRRGEWHKVVRVNAKTVSVDTGYSWVDRIPLADVIAVWGERAA